MQHHATEGKAMDDQRKINELNTKIKRLTAASQEAYKNGRVGTSRAIAADLFEAMRAKRKLIAAMGASVAAEYINTKGTEYE